MIFRPAICSLLLVLFVNALAAQCSAVVIFLKDRDTPIMGYLKGEDVATVRIEQVQSGGVRVPRTFSRVEIENIIYTVSHERLEELQMDKPKEYRQYAEELAPKQRDPEARDTAIRLYIIAAHLDPDRLGRSCMLGLISLARNEDEEATFRAMAYMLDPEHDEKVLRRPSEIHSSSSDIDRDARLRLLAAVRLLRQDRKYSARQAISHPGVQALFEQFKETLMLQEFESACLGSDISSSMLEKLVKLELTLSPGTGAIVRGGESDDQNSWHKAVRRDGLTPIPTLKLGTLTKFNPSKCYFRSGKWVEPDE